MGFLVIAAVVAVALLVALALYSKGGAKEPSTATGPVRPTNPVQLEEEALRLISLLGLEIERSDRDERRGTVYRTIDRTPVTGQRVYVRTFALAPGELATASDVQSVLDEIKQDNFNRALLISPNGFSDEAILAADATSIELIDRAGLNDLLRDLPSRPLHAGVLARTPA